MDDAAGLFEQLYDCLKSQEEIIDRLIASGETQLKALRNNYLDELNNTIQEQESYVSEMEKAEKQRLLLQESLKKALTIDDGVTMSKLLPFAPGPVRTSLEQLHTVLQEKVIKLGEINSFNSSLIKKALLVNSRLIQILNSGMSATYGLKGEIENNRQRVSVLNRSV